MSPVWGCVKMPQTRHECLEEEYDNVMKMRNSIGKCQTDTATMSRTQKPRQNKEFFCFYRFASQKILQHKNRVVCASLAQLSKVNLLLFSCTIFVGYSSRFKTLTVKTYFSRFQLHLIIKKR